MVKLPLTIFGFGFGRLLCLSLFLPLLENFEPLLFSFLHLLLQKLLGQNHFETDNKQLT